jgi:hypothetical protein
MIRRFLFSQVRTVRALNAAAIVTEVLSAEASVPQKAELRGSSEGYKQPDEALAHVRRIPAEADRAVAESQRTLRVPAARSASSARQARC